MSARGGHFRTSVSEDVSEDIGCSFRVQTFAFTLRVLGVPFGAVRMNNNDQATYHTAISNLPHGAGRVFIGRCRQSCENQRFIGRLRTAMVRQLD